MTSKEMEKYFFEFNLFDFYKRRINYVEVFLNQLGCLVFHQKSWRWCPICKNYSKMFLPFGIKPRPDAQCPHCKSLERHRFVWLYLTMASTIFNKPSKTVLHIAPEECFEIPFLSRLGVNYITADLNNPRANIKMDITKISFVDNSIDVIFCSHVLEHIVDDIKAMREFYRVLKPGGYSIIMVPLKGLHTFEDSSVVEPEQRLKLFGQKDHVRHYGMDIIERLTNVGFIVDIIEVDQIVKKNNVYRFGLANTNDKIFHCTKEVN